jgi:peptide/nickel transport system substrate-binding protein
MRRRFWVVALIAAFALIAAACGGTSTTTTEATTTTAATGTTAATTTTEAMTTTTEATGPKTVIIGVTDAISSLDPADAYSTRDWELLKNTGEALYRWAPGSATDLEPALATDMPVVSDDGLTYTVTLRDGIKFGDGTDLTAPVYANSINRALTIGPDCPNGVADALVTPFLKSVEAPDDSTVVFHLNQKVAFFTQLLATGPYIPADPNIFPDDQCVLFPPAPIYGAGPWIITQYTQQEQVVLEPNPYYNGDLKPQVDQIIVRYYSDPQTMALALQNGEIDVAWRFLGPELIQQLEGVSGVNVGIINGGAIRYLILNHTMAPFDDDNVRKAVASVVDRDQLADQVYSGQVSPLYSMVPPGFLGANEAFDTMYQSPNMAAAQQYLTDAGYSESNHLELEMYYPPEHYGAETADWMQVIKQQLEATGMIDVTLNAVEWSTYVTALTGGEAYPIGVLGWFFDYPDPSNYLDPFVYNGGEGTNVTEKQEGSTTGVGINDKAQQLVDLLVQGDTETDQTKRADIYGQAQDLMADLVTTLPLFFEPEHVSFADYIHGDAMYDSPETLNIGPNIEFNYSTLSTDK